MKKPFKFLLREIRNLSVVRKICTIGVFFAALMALLVGISIHFIGLQTTLRIALNDELKSFANANAVHVRNVAEINAQSLLASWCLIILGIGALMLAFLLRLSFGIRSFGRCQKLRTPPTE